MAQVKASASNAGDLGSIPGSGRSPGEGSGNPLQYYCLENPMDGGAWWATVHGVAKSRTRLSNLTFTNFHFHNIEYYAQLEIMLIEVLLTGKKRNTCNILSKTQTQDENLESSNCVTNLAKKKKDSKEAF